MENIPAAGGILAGRGRSSRSPLRRSTVGNRLTRMTGELSLYLRASTSIWVYFGLLLHLDLRFLINLYIDFNCWFGRFELGKLCIEHFHCFGEVVQITSFNQLICLNVSLLKLECFLSLLSKAYSLEKV